MSGHPHFDDDSYQAYSRQVDRQPVFSAEESLRHAQSLVELSRQLTRCLGLLPTVALKMVAETRAALAAGAGRPDRYVVGLLGPNGTLPDYDEDPEAFLKVLGRRLGALERAYRPVMGSKYGFDLQHEFSCMLQRSAAEQFGQILLHDQYLDELARGKEPMLSEVRGLVRTIEKQVRDVGVDDAAFAALVGRRHTDALLLSALRAHGRRHGLKVAQACVAIQEAQARLHAIATQHWINPGLLIDVAESAKRLMDGRRYHISALVAGNMRLVLSQARMFAGRGADFMDLVQEGNAGLLRAATRFDPSRGFNFSTYAVHWIRQRMSVCIDDVDLIRLPEAKNTLRRRSYAVAAKIEGRGRTATPGEIASELGAKAADVAEAMAFTPRGVSLDAPVGTDDQSSTFVDFIEDESQDPTDLVDREMVARQMERAISTLDPRSQKVVRLRFGIGVDRSYTLAEVGDALEISRERIRQIEAEALKKMRSLIDPSMLASCFSS